MTDENNNILARYMSSQEEVSNAPPMPTYLQHDASFENSNGENMLHLGNSRQPHENIKYHAHTIVNSSYLINP